MGKFEGQAGDGAVSATQPGRTPNLSAVAAATGNESLASASATYDGVTPTNGEIIFLPNQTDKKEVGLYVFAGAGNALVRSTLFDEDVELLFGAHIYVTEGTPAPSGNEDSDWHLTSDRVSIGVDDIVFSKEAQPGVTGSGTSGRVVVWGAANTLIDSTLRFDNAQLKPSSGTFLIQGLSFISGSSQDERVQFTSGGGSDAIGLFVDNGQRAMLTAVRYTLFTGTDFMMQADSGASAVLVNMDNHSSSGQKTLSWPVMTGTIAAWSKQTVDLTVDNTAITVTGTQLLLSSDSSTATERTFSLATTGVIDGQPLTIRWVSGNQAELIPSATNRTIGNGTLTFNAAEMVVKFEFDATNSEWFQTTPLITTV